MAEQPEEPKRLTAGELLNRLARDPKGLAAIKVDLTRQMVSASIHVGSPESETLRPMGTYIDVEESCDEATATLRLYLVEARRVTLSLADDCEGTP